MESIMKNRGSIAAVALLAICMAAPVMAQTPTYMTGDHNVRASKIIGMPVYNDHNEKIGVIDDILLPSSGGDVTAVLSVGGYLGGGAKMVKAPLSHVHFGTDKPMMPADKTALMAMPGYTYSGGGGG
jgi:hypothetical protein